MRPSPRSMRWISGGLNQSDSVKIVYMRPPPQPMGNRRPGKIPQVQVTSIEIHGKTLGVCLANSFARLEDSLAHDDEVFREKPLGSPSFIGRSRL